MKPQLRTGLYHLDIRSFDYESAHLYEHLLIRTFLRLLPQHGLSPYLSGWIVGETFHDVMFIQYAFYNPEAEQHFISYIKQRERVDFSLVPVELERIQAEVRRRIDHPNTEALMNELKILDAELLTSHATALASTYIAPSDRRDDVSFLPLTPDAKQFRYVTITFSIESMSLDERALFLRSTPFIHDMVNDYMSRLGAYEYDSGYARSTPAQDTTIASVAVYTIRRGYTTIKHIEQTLQRGIAALINDMEQCPDQLQRYAEVFTTTTVWEDFPIEYYRHTGILTSRDAIAQQLTPDKVIALLRKLHIVVTTTSRDHWKLLS